jgi:hypothetical protein
MDITKFVEMAGKSSLPFLYAGGRLKDEVCSKALEKAGGSSGVLAAFVSEALLGKTALAVTQDALLYPGGNTSMNGKAKMTKGALPFNDFIISRVEIKKTPGLPRLEIVFVMWDNAKQKSFTLEFYLVQNDLAGDAAQIAARIEELTSICETLCSKTGTEYTAPGAASNMKNENDYDFVYGKTHTTITMGEGNIVIKKAKIDDKTGIQVPQREPVTITRSAIDSVKIKKRFTPIPLGGFVAAFTLFGFIIYGGIIAVLLGAIIGLIFSFPKTMVIMRKDGKKFQTIISGDEDNVKEYERFLAVIFK